MNTVVSSVHSVMTAYRLQSYEASYRPLNAALKSSCVPPVSTVQRGGQIETELVLLLLWEAELELSRELNGGEIHLEQYSR